jgi:pimeloyl-ACP methyl ester carboxylesterase
VELPETDSTAATNVTEAVVPHSDHWVMEENPTATIKLVADFLK